MRRDSRGLTLIEVLVALSFTGIAFGALALSQVTGFRVTRGAQEASIAKDLGVARMELLRAYGFDAFDGCPDVAPPTGYPACSGSETASGHPGFTVSWSLTNTPDGMTATTPPSLVQADVTVTWTSLGGSPQTFDLASYLSCGDPSEGASTTVSCPATSLGPW